MCYLQQSSCLNIKQRTKNLLSLTEPICDSACSSETCHITQLGKLTSHYFLKLFYFLT